MAHPTANFVAESCVYLSTGKRPYIQRGMFGRHEDCKPFRLMSTTTEILLKLFYSPGACSLSPHIALLEAGIPFTLSKVDLKNKKVESGEDFNAVNGKGYVPALQLDNGQILTEGPAIVQYIADQKPAAGLAPATGTIERYKLQEWLNFINFRAS